VFFVEEEITPVVTTEEEHMKIMMTAITITTGRVRKGSIIEQINMKSQKM